MCGGQLGGGQQRSSCITLVPQHLTAGHYLADTGTAGSCTLMVQQALPCCVFANAPSAANSTPTTSSSSTSAAAAGDAQQRWTQLDLRGGTDAAFAPPIGYLQHVLAPTLRRLLPVSVGLDIHVQRRGFYPKGGGHVVVRARALPAGESLPALDVTDRGRLKEVRVMAFSAGRVQHSDAQRMATAAVQVLQEALRGPKGGALVRGPAAAAGVVDDGGGDRGVDGGDSINGEGVAVVQGVVREGEATAMGDGGGLLLVAESDTGRLWGASALWERGVPPGSAGKAAAEELAAAVASGACVDEWMQDQLIVWMALASGTSRMLAGELSLHTRTAMVVAAALLPAKFTVTEVERCGGGQQLYMIECRGAGVQQQA